MNWRPALVLAVLAGVLLAVVLPALSTATPARKNSAIAFARYRFANSPLREEIWAANPDGSDAHRLERASANTLDTNPDWSPDGSHLIFMRCPPVKGKACEGRQTIWSVSADGSGLHQLSPECHSANPAVCPNDGDGVYSPNGRKIAVLRYTGVPTITVTDDNLRHGHEIFPFGDHKGAPDIGAVAWSPNGKSLAFSVHNNNGKKYQPFDGRAIFVIAANGSHLRRVTPWKLKTGADGLAWSSRTDRILFSTVTYEAGGPGPSYGQIYTVKPDGSGVVRLTHVPADTGVQLGSYSPDGKQIVFSTNSRAMPNGGGQTYPDVFVMNADGSHVHAVTHTKNWEGTAAWGK
jgi:Tol biopolymer transport system component